MKGRRVGGGWGRGENTEGGVGVGVLNSNDTKFKQDLFMARILTERRKADD